MGKPELHREGDAFFLTWSDYSIGFAFDRLRETYQGLTAELTVDSVRAETRGLVYGPVTIGIMSTRSHEETSRMLSSRVNLHKPEKWLELIAQACAMVCREWRAPSPVFDLSEIDTSKIVEYMVNGLIPKGETTIMYGDGESAKSMLALTIAACVQTGTVLPWGIRPPMGNVLYLDWETTPQTVGIRLRRLAHGMGIAPPQVKYRQCFRNLSDELPEIRRVIERDDIALVVVDSIGFAAHGALVEDETARSALGALRQMDPATRLVIAHVSASDARDDKRAARPFGSAFFWNGMRSGIEVRRTSDESEPDEIDVALYHRKANDGRHSKAIGLRVLFDGLDGPIGVDPQSLDESPELEARLPTSTRLRKLLKDGKWTVKALAEEIDEPPEKVRTTLNRMKDAIRLVDGGGSGNETQWGLKAL